MQNLHGSRNRSRLFTLWTPHLLLSVRSSSDQLPSMPTEHSGNSKNVHVLNIKEIYILKKYNFYSPAHFVLYLCYLTE